MTLRQLIGQLVQFDPTMARERAGKTLEELVKNGDVGVVCWAGDLPDDFLALQHLAVKHGQVPLVMAADTTPGVWNVMPAGFGIANTWNPKLLERAKRRVARHMAIAGIGWEWGPIADYPGLTNRHPRCQENGIESPYLSGVMVAAQVRGSHGESLQDPDSVATTEKHVGAYICSPLDYASYPVSWRYFLENCWPSFQAGFEAGATAGMLCFGMLDGRACHADRRLVELINKHGGPLALAVADHSGINALEALGVAGSFEEAALLSFRAGLHLDLAGGVYHKHLEALVKSGKISEHEIRVRAAEMMTLKKRLGILDNPFKYGRPAEKRVLAVEFCPEYLELAEESIVLLEPECAEYPLLPGDADVLITGPLAHSRMDMLGAWAGHAWQWPDLVTTLYEGLQTLKSRSLRYVEGVGFDKPAESWGEALAAAETASHVLVTLGEPGTKTGEASSFADVSLPEAQIAFVEAIAERMEAKVIVSITAGRPLAVPDRIRRAADSVIWLPQLRTYAGQAYANVLSGRKNFSGRLGYSLPCHELVTYGAQHNVERVGRAAVVTSPLTWSYRASEKYPGDPVGWVAAYRDLGRGIPGLAKYSFGYGGSYTTFAVVERRMSGDTLSVAQGEPLRVEVTVRNTGPVAGKETVPLFYHDRKTASAGQPYLRLIGFEQVWLEPGEEVTVTFKIEPDMLAHLGKNVEEGLRPWPDPFPDYLFAGMHAGEALECLKEIGKGGLDPERILSFTLTE